MGAIYWPVQASPEEEGEAGANQEGTGALQQALRFFLFGFHAFSKTVSAETLLFEGEESQGPEDDPWHGAQTTGNPKIADIVQVTELLHTTRLDYKLLTGNQHCAWHGSWIKGHSVIFGAFGAFRIQLLLLENGRVSHALLFHETILCQAASKEDIAAFMALTAAKGAAKREELEKEQAEHSRPCWTIQRPLPFTSIVFRSVLYCICLINLRTEPFASTMKIRGQAEKSSLHTATVKVPENKPFPKCFEAKLVTCWTV